MKRVIIVATFAGYCPEDMDINQIGDAVEKELNDRINMFRIHLRDYHNEPESEPLFDLTSVQCGTEIMITVG